MIDMQTVTDLQTAQGHWADTLAQLRQQMTTATFDFCLAGSQVLAVRDDGAYRVAVAKPTAVEWLANRLQSSVERALTAIAGRQVELEFVALSGPLPDQAGPREAEELPAGDTRSHAGLVVANADYHAGFFGRGTDGYAQLPHHSTYFWVPLLDRAFALLNILTATDRRPLSTPAHYWTPPVEYTYTELAGKLNRRHPRYISGDEIECSKSREGRLKGDRPLRTAADCCHSPRYDLLRYKPHPRENCLLCLHWKAGLLEVLERWGLVAIELKDFGDSYKFRVQAWRLLPILTPYQCRLLTPPLQADYFSWLRQWGHRYDIPDLAFWQSITEESIIPLMPTHDQPEITHNFDQRRKRQEFLRHAVANPGYGQEEGEDDEM